MLPHWHAALATDGRRQTPAGERVASRCPYRRQVWLTDCLTTPAGCRNGLYGMAILPLVVLPTDRLPMLYRGGFRQFVPEGPLKIAQHLSAGL